MSEHGGYWMIKKDGFLAYLYTSLLANEIRILPDWLLYKRLCYLYNLTDEQEDKKHIEFIYKHIWGYCLALEEVFTDQENESSFYKNTSNEIEIFCSNIENGEIKNIKNEHHNNSNICLLTTMPGIYNEKWEFIIGDPDPNPSVPHGHLVQRKKIKLDAYRGYIYGDNKNLKKRETKEFIASLWNDEKFRCFAHNAINQFLSSQPHFNLRRYRSIKNPYKLPRKNN